MQHHLVVQDCFNSIVRLREAGDDALCAQDVHALLMAAMHRMMENPGALSLSTQEAQDIAFCIAALADEAAMRCGEQVADVWQDQKLQTHFFGHHGAGELFYERLAALRQQPGQKQVVFAYYTALALGFEGKLSGPQGAGDIKRLILDLRRLLEGPQRSTDDCVLSPHALSPERPKAGKRLMRAPTVVLLAALGSFSLTLVGLQTLSRARVQQVVERADLRLSQMEGSAEASAADRVAEAEEAL